MIGHSAPSANTAEPSTNLSPKTVEGAPNARSSGSACVRDDDSRPGLVHIKTSDTPKGWISVDPKLARLKKTKQAVITSARLHQEAINQGPRRYKPAFLTLTYRPGEDYDPCDVSKLLKSIRNWLLRRKQGFRYVWVLELTKKGVPHYHLMLWLPKGLSLPKPDKQGWWKKGYTKIEWARRPVGYMAKYSSKGTDYQGLPKGARVHGCGGLEQDQRNERIWWLAPSWVREHWDNPEHLPRRAPGGGWYSKASGEWIPSPWEIDINGGVVWIRKKEDSGGTPGMGPRSNAAHRASQEAEKIRFRQKIGSQEQLEPEVQG